MRLKAEMNVEWRCNIDTHTHRTMKTAQKCIDKQFRKLGLMKELDKKIKEETFKILEKNSIITPSELLSRFRLNQLKDIKDLKERHIDWLNRHFNL